MELIPMGVGLRYQRIHMELEVGLTITLLKYPHSYCSYPPPLLSPTLQVLFYIIQHPTLLSS